MRFIGDIHGKLRQYTALLDVDESVQIGDFGWGWISETQTAQIDKRQATGKHRFIRGNHDDPSVCRDRPGWIGDGTFDAARSIMYVGGAWSIDVEYRTPGLNWWPDEELSLSDFSKITEDYARHKPRIMVTHDTPTSVAAALFFPFGTKKKQHPTRTAHALQHLFELHQPDLWLFGHWHESRKVLINGTEFRCLNELEVFDVEL